MLGDGETAVVEMAAASGIALVPREQRDPLRACSYGTGQLIRAALDHGAQRLILAIGGSATNDGGAGMLAALGAQLLDAAGEPLPPGGAALAKLATLDLSALDPRLAQCRIDIACDVRNPLLGEHGASAVFGPQKGATPAMVAQLDAALARYAAVLHATTGCDAANLPGSGAAGGMGAAALAVLGGRMQAGIELVLDAAGLAAALQGADLVITGEGRLDGQSAFGKTPVGVATLAARHGVPTIAIGGALGDGVEALQQHHIRAVFACVDRITTLDAALGNAAANLARVAGNVGALLALGVGVSR
jgi:glycerate kinase